MGGRQSKRSVDITTTQKKGDEEVATSGVGEGEGRVEKINEDVDQLKVSANGVLHTEIDIKVSDLTFVILTLLLLTSYYEFHVNLFNYLSEINKVYF